MCIKKKFKLIIWLKSIKGSESMGSHTVELLWDADSPFYKTDIDYEKRAVFRFRREHEWRKETLVLLDMIPFENILHIQMQEVD